jgi:hypothetical protein
MGRSTLRISLGPQAPAIYELGSELVDLRGGVIAGHDLIFESAVMSHRVEVAGRLATALSRDSLVKTRVGQQEIDEIAVESVGGTPQGFQLDGVA